MFYRSLFTVVALLGFVALRPAWPDSITIEGKTYTNVKISESPSRYYVQILSQGRTISVLKKDVKPEDVHRDGEGAEEAVLAAPASNAGVPGVGAPLQAGAVTMFISTRTPNEDQLEINVLVLRAGEQYMAICSIDTAALSYDFVKLVARKLTSKRSAIRRENLMLTATHTYASTMSGLVRGPVGEVLFGDFAEDEFDYAANRVVDAISNAEKNLRPARLRAGMSEIAGLTRNRAVKELPVDPTVSVAAVEARDGSPIAYLVNYAAQPLFLAEKGPKPGRDYPGGVAAEIRKVNGAEDIPVLFLYGAGGDVAPNPPEAGVSSTQAARQMGQAVAQGALAALKDAASHDMVALKVRSRDVDLPPHMVSQFIPKTTILQDFWVDDVVFLSMPGDVSCAIGVALRNKALQEGAKCVFLVGAAGDYAGYHTDAEGYFKSLYEATLSFYGPLMISWYLDQHLPAVVQKPSEPWTYSPLVAKYRETFEQARRNASVERDNIQTQWKGIDAQLTDLKGIVRRMRESGTLPTEADKILQKVSPAEAIEIGKQYAAYFVRHAKSDLSDEQRVKLMGVADGAQLPFDAIMLLQFMATPSGMDSEIAALFQILDVKGMDFLK